MRRLALMLMICLLPLQGSWATVTSVCKGASAPTLIGHHLHPAAPPEAQEARHTYEAAGTDATADALGNGGDCQGCTGACAAPCSHAPALADWQAEPPTRLQRLFIPEPPLAPLLRPPLSLVA